MIGSGNGPPSFLLMPEGADTALDHRLGLRFRACPSPRPSQHAGHGDTLPSRQPALNAEYRVVFDVTTELDALMFCARARAW